MHCNAQDDNVIYLHAPEKLLAYKTILVAVDQSDHAKKAFQAAVSLAKAANSRLLVLHVALPAPVAEDVSPSMLAAVERSYVRLGNALLADYVLEAQSKHDLDVEAILETGDAREKILQVAREKKADLIVVGSRGMGRLKGLLLGSVSTGVVQSSEIPVLVSK